MPVQNLLKLAKDSGYPDLSYHNWLLAQVEAVKATHILEVGGLQGSTAVAMAKAKHNPKISIIDDFEWADYDALRTNLSNCVAKIWEIDRGKDLARMPEFLLSNPDVDFIHLDADHATYGVLGELIAVHMYSDCQTVVVHDRIDPSVQNGVKLFKHWYGEHWDIQEVTNVFNHAYLIRRHDRSRKQSSALTNIIVPPGIGDIAWVWQKLPEDFGPTSVQICRGGPPRSKPFCEILPGVTHAVEINEPYHWLSVQRIPHYADPRLFRGTSFPMEVNSFLEGDYTMETVFPTVPTRYSIPFNIAPAVAERARQAIPDSIPTIGIYTSSQANKSWGKHSPIDWLNSASRIYETIKPCRIAVIGAGFDREYTDPICAGLMQRNIPYLPIVGQHIGFVIEAVRHMKALFAFPSGIGIIGSLVNTPTVMGMPGHLPKLQYKWVDPAMRASGRFIHHPIEDLNGMTKVFLNELRTGP